MVIDDERMVFDTVVAVAGFTVSIVLFSLAPNILATVLGIIFAGLAAFSAINVIIKFLIITGFASYFRLVLLFA